MLVGPFNKQSFSRWFILIKINASTLVFLYQTGELILLSARMRGARSQVLSRAGRSLQGCCLCSNSNLPLAFWSITSALYGGRGSFTSHGFVFVQRKDFPGEQFFVVFVIKPEDYACGGSVPSSIHGELCWGVDLLVQFGGGAAEILWVLPVGWQYMALLDAALFLFFSFPSSTPLLLYYSPACMEAHSSFCKRHFLTLLSWDL